MKRLSVVSCQLSVRKALAVSCELSAKKIIFISFLLFTVHFSPATFADADEIKSKAALVMDASTGRVLFAKNPGLRLPPASTVKLVTAMVVLDKGSLDDVVTISDKAAKVPSIKPRFKVGETLTVKTLLNAALLRSSNEAAFALGENIAGSEEKFVGLMNQKLITIGAFNTKFINTTGLPGKGQYITAYDLAKILRYSLKYPVIREILGTKAIDISTEEGRVVSLENTNRLLWWDEGAIGGKTGFTRTARHCFVYAGERNGETIIVALLGAPNRFTLWNESNKLTEKGFYVLATNEQPVVYFTKADYANGSKSKIKRSKAKRQPKEKARAVRVSSKKRIKNEEQKKKTAGNYTTKDRRSDIRLARDEKNAVKG